MSFQKGKVVSTSFQQNRAGKEILTCVVEIRRGQNVTAEYIQSPGDVSTPILGEWLIVAPQAQSFGGYLAFGAVDIINELLSERGVKIIYGRSVSGEIRTRISLTDSDIYLEGAENAQIILSGDNVLLNEGEGDAVEHGRLQQNLDSFSALVLAELQKIAALLEPKNPAAPYVPPASLPIDIEASKSETVKLP